MITLSENEDKMKRLFEMSEKAYVISNSIKSKIILEPTIMFFKGG